MQNKGLIRAIVFEGQDHTEVVTAIRDYVGGTNLIPNRGGQLNAPRAPSAPYRAGKSAGARGTKRKLGKKPGRKQSAAKATD